MTSKKTPQKKVNLHPRNKNRSPYDLTALVNTKPELATYLQRNTYGNTSIDFSNPIAVRTLNTALLHHYYGVTYWEFPKENLCPPIPGRADYIHHMADLLASNTTENIPTGTAITCLDIGVGASCIYPIIGVTEYQWKFIGTDISQKSIAAAQHIIAQNPRLKNNVMCRLQKDAKQLFEGVISSNEKIDCTVCNPPFHSSREAAEKGTRRKIKNLSGKEAKNPTLNFSGIHNELICKGGEYAFINRMIKQSVAFSQNCYWFSTLVSKKEHLRGIKKSLKKAGAYHVRTIAMNTGNKSSRIVAWTFLTEQEQQDWQMTRWAKNKGI